ncbi:MAG: peptidase MA family metallohydrolase [Anaerolineales bacterium]|nr:peptidase MA family metallohydrolase [Anaerolineales bacterium]MDW8226784.1 peptidase MA family metallohydrolase [Anaerolineales bacterium]
MHISLLLLISVIMGLLLPTYAQAQQTTPEIHHLTVEYVFGESVTFRAQLVPAVNTQEAYLLFLVQGEPTTHLIPVQPTADGFLEYRHSPHTAPLRPFAKIEYWFQVKYNDKLFSSERASFRYIDNRYPWQTLSDQRLSLHWYAGEMEFGQAAFDIARQGLAKAETYLGISLNSPMDIYIYASVADLQDALQLENISWVGGHSSPDLGVILVSIEPGPSEKTEMERQIPHEIAHILLYQMTGPNYTRLPTWLVEGIASQFETTINQDYIQVLTYAKHMRSLLPINGLCGPFPPDVSGALLAYAESESFVRYLQTSYGTSGLQRLIYAYADGLGCEQGARHALGLSLSQLDLHWQQAVLGEKIAPVALQNLSPYFVLLLILLTIPLLPLLFKPTVKRNLDERSLR